MRIDDVVVGVSMFLRHFTLAFSYELIFPWEIITENATDDVC